MHFNTNLNRINAYFNNEWSHKFVPLYLVLYVLRNLWFMCFRKGRSLEMLIYNLKEFSWHRLPDYCANWIKCHSIRNPMVFDLATGLTSWDIRAFPIFSRAVTCNIYLLYWLPLKFILINYILIKVNLNFELQLKIYKLVWIFANKVF